MKRFTVIELHKEENGFSAGHFTIFSATDREDLHGHNYSVSLALRVIVNQNGLEFDYRIYKKKLQSLCQQLDRHFLLPSQSQYLRLEETSDMWFAHFDKERIPFLKRDVVILPIENVTIEALSHWFLNELMKDKTTLFAYPIQGITVTVFNGPGQSASANSEALPLKNTNEGY